MALWTRRKRSASAGSRAIITVWATPDQWKAVAQLAHQANWTETDLGRRAGFTKDAWRDFYGRLRAAGLLLPKGNGPKAGYRPHPELLKILDQRPWGDV
jgi:hypothetical protein